MILLKKKVLFFVVFMVVFIILLLLCFQTQNFAATPKLVSKLENAFKNIKSWIMKLATPAAAVAVGTGIFMQKFSLGDEEKIRTGKKIVRTSLISYSFILAIDLILSAIESFI